MIDGFVTEYVEIQKSVIGLYKQTLSFEKDKERIKAIESRIEELVESVRSQLNEKYFKKQYVELSAELAELRTRQFEALQKAFTEKNKKLKQM